MTGPSSAAEDQAAVPMAPVPKAIATVLMMAATILVVLDQTIASVALPHMQAALGATPETINWVLTSYILATAVSTPLTGWLTGRVGRSRLFGICVLGFTLSSALCGLAVSLPMMVCARLSQGFFGAFLIPMSQTFLYDMNPPSRQVRAMTIWGVGSMAGPLLGPIIGGYLTEALNWRWVFFINVPIGLVAAAGILTTLPKFPAARRAFDHAGFAMIVIALCGLQLALDRGTQQDWFESTEIIIELGVSAAAFWMLIIHLRHTSSPIIAVSLFRNRSYAIAMILMMTLMPVIVAATALLPSLLQVLLGYPVADAGLLVIPRSISMALGIILGGRMMRLIDGRIQMALGLLCVMASLAVQTRFDLQMDAHLIILSGLLQGAGAGMVMTVLNMTVVAAVPTALRTEAAALSNLFRNTGASLMIAIFTGILSHNIRVNHAELSAAVGSHTTSFALSQAFGGFYPTGKVVALVDAEVSRQAMMIAYIDDFWLMMWVIAALIPLVFLLKPVSRDHAGREALTMAD